MRKTISQKANSVLHIILFLTLIIAFRTWQLSIIQKEERLLDARKPQRRTILIHADRGTICDRFDQPLAVNKIQYNASVYFAHIRGLPTVKWLDKETKIYPRRDEVKRLSKFLASELNLNAEKIEDLIWSKASLLPHVPFVIKENIDEKTYYKMRMLEKEIVGLHAEIVPKRFYPLEKCGSSVIGYMGKIEGQKYLSLVDEMKKLQEFAELDKDKADPIVPQGFKNKEEVLLRLKELKEKAYSINDLVGKSGIEGKFEEALRGYHGKKTLIMDVKGNFSKETAYPKKPIAGQRIKLTISAALQEFAEEILAEEEKLRSWKAKNKFQEKVWIKGGAIVALNPNNGEIIALASYPRFNPNDFASKNKNIERWLETAKYIADLWDGKEKLRREFFNGKFLNEETSLSLELFLDLILPDGDLKESLYKIYNIKNAITLQEEMENLLFNSKKRALDLVDTPKINRFLYSIKKEKEKLLAIDICRTLVYSPAFSDELIEKVGQLSLFDYWKFSKALLKLEATCKAKIKPLFYDLCFQEHKRLHKEEFLRKKRAGEKYTHPYADYFIEWENRAFSEFWNKNFPKLLTLLIKNGEDEELNNYLTILKNTTLPSDALHYVYNKLAPLSFNLSHEFIKTVRPFEKLERPLLHNEKLMEKHLAASFYKSASYCRSFAYREAAPLGSIFKIVTSYAVLKERYLKNPSLLNPLIMIDNIAHKDGALIVGYSMENKPFFRFYKGGRLPHSAHGNIGKVDLISALEQSSNPYFSIIAGDHLETPEKLLEAAKEFGFGKKTGIDLEGEFSGHLPTDIDTNKTSLYSFAIGQHSLLATPLQAAVMLSSLVNGGLILKPKLIANEALEIQNKIDLPDPIKNTILEGLRRVVFGKRGKARAEVIRKLKKDPELFSKYVALKGQMIGKTSTAEKRGKMDLLSTKTCKDGWFGAVFFEKESKKPELAVVVYLQFSEGGKELAPLAAKIIHKYRSLKGPVEKIHF